jgi:hypothetical protein
MGSLRSLALACNNLSGPDMLTNLQVVDLANKSLAWRSGGSGGRCAQPSVVLSGNRVLPEPGAGRGHRARLGARRQQGQGRARGRRRRRRSARRCGRLPRCAEGGREARQGQAALAAGGWCMVEHASSISAYPSQPFTDVRHISPVAGSWISSGLKRTGIDGADAVTFNLTECYFLIIVPSFWCYFT